MIVISFAELEQPIVHVEKFQRQTDGTDDHALAADVRTRRKQGEGSGGRGGRDNGYSRDNVARGRHSNCNFYHSSSKKRISSGAAKTGLFLPEVSASAAILPAAFSFEATGAATAATAEPIVAVSDLRGMELIICERCGQSEHVAARCTA